MQAWPAAAYAALAATALAAVMCEGLRRLALGCGLTDRPGPRKSHRRPTPYLGGVAIAAGTLLATWAVISRWERQLVVVMVASGAVALLGLVDDVRPLTRTSRVLAESVAASAVVACGVRMAVFGNWLDAAATVVWIVVLTNSFNLLDNMDGAAAAVASGSACCVAGNAYLGGRADIAILLLALAAGCLGFLMHNWFPARIFMGDSGSLFIGFVISVTIVMIRVRGGPVAVIADSFLFMFVAIVDTGLVVIARLNAGLSWLTAGTDHASHRLHMMGLGVGQVALTLFVAAAVPGLCGMLVADGRLPGMATLGVTTVTAVVLVLLLMRIPIYQLPAENPANIRIKEGNRRDGH